MSKKENDFKKSLKVKEKKSLFKTLFGSDEEVINSDKIEDKANKILSNLEKEIYGKDTKKATGNKPGKVGKSGKSNERGQKSKENPDIEEREGRIR